VIEEDDDLPRGELPFARSYDSFKHSTSLALFSLGGVFAFTGGGAIQFKPAQIIVILAFIGIAGITSMLMVGALATLEVKPEPREVMARRIRIAQMVIGCSMFGGIGGFTYNFVRALLK
jgi:ABC-type Na+ efflux pump permease subunit